MNWPLISGAALAVLMHSGLLLWLAGSLPEDAGAALDTGEYGLASGVGMIGSYSETSNRIDAVLAPPEPEVVPEPQPEPVPEVPVLKQPEPLQEAVKDSYQVPEPEKEPEPEEVAEPEPEPEPIKEPSKPESEITNTEKADPDSNEEQAQEASVSARRASGSAEQQANGGRRGNATNYIQTLNQWLARHRTYPAAAKRSKQEGTVRLAFTMNRKGDILKSHIAGSSGYAQLDEAALKMLQEAAPLPEVPDDFYPSRDTLPLVMPIEYSLITNSTFGE